MRKCPLPVEGVDALDFLLVREDLPLEVVPIDQRVAAADILTQIRQNALKPERKLTGLAFQQLEQQRKLRHFHRLRVDVHPVHAGGQNAFFGVRRQAVFAPLRRYQGRVLAARVGLRVVAEVIAQVPIQKVQIGAEQE